MNPGLRYLLGRIPAVLGRRLRRALRGVRALLVLLVVVLILAPQVLLAWTSTGPAPATLEAVRTWAPLVLVLMALMNLSSGAAFAFRPQEVDFLFPAPITRRELLLYKVVTTLAGGLLGSFWLSVLLFRHAPHGWAGAVALVLATWFLQMVSLLAGVAAAAADAKLTRWVRIVVWSLVGLAAGVGVVVVRWLAPANAGLGHTLSGTARAWPMQVLAFPGRIFTEVFLAADLYSFLTWTALALALLLGLFLLLVRLDLAWTEGSVRQSQLLLQRLKRAASEGVIGTSGSRLSGLRLPMPPRCLGLGPLVWRQATEVLRNLRSVITTLVFFVGIPVVIVLWMRQEGGTALRMVMPLLVISLMSPHVLAFDFRRDLDRMAMFKALPLTPFAIAAGQVAMTVLLRSGLHALVFGGIAVLTNELSRDWQIAVLLMLVPINWMVAALDNALFLLWPHRIVAKGGEATMGHRAMFAPLLKMLILMPPLGLCAGAGWMVASTTGMPLLAGAVASVGCTGFAVLFTLWLARCFARYDVASLASD